MKKELDNEFYLISLIILTGFVFLVFFTINFQATGNVVEEPYVPSECSDEEIIKVWESVFKESPGEIKVVVPSEAYTLLNETSKLFKLTGCPVYEAYQIDNNQVRMLRRSEIFFPGNNEMITASEFYLKPEEVENFTLFLQNSSEGVGNYFFFVEESKLILRNISNISEAQSNFESIFKVQSSNWTLNQEFGADIYGFDENKTMENLTIFGNSLDPKGVLSGSGFVIKNYSLTFYMYMAGADLGQAKYLSNEYENWTSFINTTIKNTTIKINNSELTISDFLLSIMLGPDDKGTQKVEILQENKPIVETEINFTEYLNFTYYFYITDNFNWTEIILKKQNPTETAGYIIINGLNSSKNVTVDKLQENSEAVCIKDSEINSISEISNDCNSSNEYLLDCPGSGNGYTCQITNNSFFITGLMHSAVLEFIPLEPEVCIPNWDCTDWTEKEDQCGYRNCLDLNNCGNLSGMPLEYKECPIKCVPEWECSDWSPEKCPKDLKQTRNCEDINNCGILSGRPNLSRSCERESNPWVWILLGILVVLIALLLILSLTSPKRHRNIQDQTHNPHPDNEYDEKEMPLSPQEYTPEDSEKKDFQEFRQNKRLSQNPNQHPPQNTNQLKNYQRDQRFQRKY